MAWKNLEQKGEKMNPKWACYARCIFARQWGHGEFVLRIVVTVVWTALHFFACGACLLQLRHRYWSFPCGPAVGRWFGAVHGTAVSFRRGR